MKKTKREKIITATTWLIIIFLWWLVTKLDLVSPIVIPSPKKVLIAFYVIAKDGYNHVTLWGHLMASFERLFIAIGFAIITAIPIGLLSGYNKTIRAIVDSVVEFIRPLPPLAYYTVLILWLGIANTSKIVLLFIAAFAPIYIACVSAVAGVNQNYILSAKSLGVNRKQLFFNIVLKAALPEVFTGIRTAVGVAYTTLVSAEMVAAVSGIGWMVLDASNYLRSDVIFVGIIIMGITGILLNYLLKKIEHKFVFWKGYV